MTVSSSTRRAGPFNGNGATVAFPFTFKVFAKDDIAVYLTDLSGAQTLTTNYSVTLNPDQDVSPGGTIFYPLSGGGTALPVGYKLDVVGNLAYNQTTDITNLGRFLPQVIENALDRAVILMQQLLEKAGRAVSVPVGDSKRLTLPPAALRAGKAIIFDENGDIGVSADTAAQSAAAQAARLAIDNRIYPGTYLTLPATRPDGSAIQNGDRCVLNTGIEYIRLSGAWVDYRADAATSAASALSSKNASSTSEIIAATYRTEAVAARDAAVLARDASFALGPKYATEALGRAAVADGATFLVQGSGDVAAFEYRRTNSSTSTLIATYPSKAAVDRFKGQVGAGAALSAVVKSGTYYIPPANGNTDLPAGWSTAASSLLIVHDAFAVDGRFQLQVLHLWGSPQTCKFRWLDHNNPALNDWVSPIDAGAVGTSQIVDASVTAAKLADAFNDRGAISSGSANGLLKAGIYLIAGGVADLPEGAPASGYLQCARSGVYAVQTYAGLFAPDTVWRRYIRTDNGTIGAWGQVGAPADLSITTAKLNDKAVTAAKLADRFSDRGVVASGSANNLRLTGTYLVTPTTSDLPAGAATSGFLEVTQSGVWLCQTFANLTEPDRTWRRYIRTDNGTIGAWAPVKTGPFIGKTVAFIGDSITEFGDYPSRVAARLGCKALQFGFGGCRMGKHNTAADGLLYDKMCMYNLARYINTGVFTELIQAADDLYALNADDNRPQAAAFAATNWAAVDYMVIFFGTNDWAGDLPLGADSDADGTTFKGAINYTVDKIMSAYPNIKILFVAPMWRARRNGGDGLDADTNPRGDGKYLIDFVDALKARANANKLPAIDLYRESGINKYNQATLLADGLHPVGGAGYQLIADKVASGLMAKY